MNIVFFSKVWFFLMAVNKNEKQKGLSLPKSGEEADDKFLSSLYPRPEKGMNWLYAMMFNINGINIQAELMMEITDIIGEMVKIKTTFGDQVTENTTTLDAFSPIPAKNGSKVSSGFLFVNNEDVIVPAGTYKGVFKFSSLGHEGENLLWLAPGVGPIKYGVKVSGIPATLELKSFGK